MALEGHTDWIRSIDIAYFTDSDVSCEFQNGDVIIASASQDKYIRLWKLSQFVDLDMNDMVDALGDL